ncbi:Eco57I restriction-modification methylase domain-containing protein, partial [Chloroflexota bacterium]
MDILQYAKAIFPADEKITFLDPAIGTGSFYSALLRTFPAGRISKAEGYEIDSRYADIAARLWKEPALTLHFTDFTKATSPRAKKDRFNLIICNPPYVRHHHIDNEEKAHLKLKAMQVTGISLNGLSGLYCYFIALAHAWMTRNGIAGWLIPNEFMYVNYGQALKQYFTNSVTLLRIHRFDPNDLQFSDALVSSTVVWFQKAKPQENQSFEFTYGGTLAKPKTSKRVSLTQIRKEAEWRFLFKPAIARNHPSVATKLGDLFAIKRGLATGDNSFFILSRQQIEEYRLPTEVFRPILPSPRYMQANEISADQDGNPCLTLQLFLLDCKLPEYEVK